MYFKWIISRCLSNILILSNHWFALKFWFSWNPSNWQVFFGEGFIESQKLFWKANTPNMWEKIKRKSAYTDITVPRHDGKRKSKLQNICIVRQHLCKNLKPIKLCIALGKYIYINAQQKGNWRVYTTEQLFSIWEGSTFYSFSWSIFSDN